MLVSKPTTPALADALGSLLPTPEQTRLLRACLQRGEAGRQAWADWRSLVDDPTSAAARALPTPTVGSRCWPLRSRKIRSRPTRSC